MELRYRKALIGLVVLLAVGVFTAFPQLKPDWIHLNGRFGQPEHSDTTAAAYDRIITCIESEKWDDAILELNALLEREPSDADAFFLRGLAWYNRGQSERAEADLSAALRLQPDHVDALLNLAGIRLDRGEMDQALADIEQAILLAPDAPEAYGIRGRWREEQCDYRRALSDYEQAFLLAPDDPQALNDLAWILAAAPQEKLRDPARALKTALRAVEIDGGEQWESLDTLASAYAAGGDFAAALQHQTDALRHAPAEKRDDLQQRLDLYRARQPYRLPVQRE